MTLLDGPTGTGNGNMNVLVAAGNLTVNTGGAVNLSTGNALAIGASSAGANSTFSVNSFAGLITIAGNITAGSVTINAPGGIVESSTTPGTIFANSLNLQNSSFSQSIGTLTAPILTQVASLQMSSTTNAFISNSGSISLGNISAANFGTLVISTTPLNNNGQIVIDNGTISVPNSILTLPKFV